MADKTDGDASKQRDSRGRFNGPNDTSFQPGGSGNPKGSSKGRRLGARLKKLLFKNDGELAAEVMKSLIKQAISAGDVQAMKLILERVDGKMPQAVELGTTVRSPLACFSDQELQDILDGKQGGDDDDSEVDEQGSIEG